MSAGDDIVIDANEQVIVGFSGIQSFKRSACSKTHLIQLVRIVKHSFHCGPQFLRVAAKEAGPQDVRVNALVAAREDDPAWRKAPVIAEIRRDTAARRSSGSA